MTTHTLYFHFNPTLYIGQLQKELVSMTDTQAIEHAQKMLEENSMIDEIIVWSNESVITQLK